MVSSIIQLRNLPSRKLSALKRKAEHLGISPEAYVKQLIETDLALDRKAQTSSFDDLATPFRKAFKGISEDELDRVVNVARGPRLSKQKRRQTCSPPTSKSSSIPIRLYADLPTASHRQLKSCDCAKPASTTIS